MLKGARKIELELPLIGVIFQSSTTCLTEKQGNLIIILSEEKKFIVACITDHFSHFDRLHFKLASLLRQSLSSVQ